MGVFWPCSPTIPRRASPSDHPGTPRLFEPGSYNPVAKGSGPFYFPDGKARFNVARLPAARRRRDEEYPVFLTTGRVVSQFLSGTQTRRIGPLVRAVSRSRGSRSTRGWPSKLGIATGDWATAETRRGSDHAAGAVVTTIRPDTVFIPYHWAGPKSANQLTVAAQDPDQQDPAVQGVRVPRAEGRRQRRPMQSTLEPQQ